MEQITQLSSQDLLLFTFLVLLGIIAIALLVIGGFLITVLQKVIQAERAAKGLPTEGYFARLAKSWTNAAPVEKEGSILLDHNYDGIQELDNHLPPWWKWMFYASIAFSVIYLIDYHLVGNSPLQEQELAIEIERAAISVAEYKQKMANSIDENTAQVLLDDPKELAAGKEVYDANCKSCHGGLGEGGVGPNLTDEFWLHGGGMQNIFKTVKYGVPSKGMIAWEQQLPPAKIQSVSNYILSLQGTNPPNAKEAQGEKYQAE
jgi:cytochrome c oxidase cbb3-type subunit 3